MRTVVAGVDIGGTNMVGGLVDSSGACLYKSQRPTQARKGAETVFANIVSMVKDTLQWADGRSYHVARVGVSTAGQVDSSGRIAYATDTFPGWTGFPLRQRLEAELGLKVYVENDALAAAWGEKYFGLARDADDFIMLTLGTGIGGAIFSRGRLFTGFANLAGLIGHMTIDPLGIECNCGGRGCLERYAAATAIVQQVRDALGVGTKSRLADPAFQGTLTAKDVFDAAREGDVLAQSVLERAALYLGAGIGSLLNLLNPELVVLSGGLTLAGEWWLHIVEQNVEKYATEAAREGVALRYSEFLSECGLFGAAAVGHSCGIPRL